MEVTPAMLGVVTVPETFASPETFNCAFMLVGTLTLNSNATSESRSPSTAPSVFAAKYPSSDSSIINRWRRRKYFFRYDEA